MSTTLRFCLAILIGIGKYTATTCKAYLAVVLSRDCKRDVKRMFLRLLFSAGFFAHSVKDGDLLRSLPKAYGGAAGFENPQK